MEASNAQTVSAPSSPVSGTQNLDPAKLASKCQHDNCPEDLSGKNRGEILNHYKHKHPNEKVNPPEPTLFETQVANTPVKRARRQPSSVSPVAAPPARASRKPRTSACGNGDAERAMSPSNRRSTGSDQACSQQRMLEPSSQESDTATPAQPPAPPASQPLPSQQDEVTSCMSAMLDYCRVPFSPPPTAEETIDTLLSPTMEPRLTQQSVVSDSSFQQDGDSEFGDLPPL
jgi:hypothetical protein